MSRGDKIIPRICQRCGKKFDGNIYKHFCPDCLKKIKAESTIRERACIDCGRTFVGGPKSKRCPSCQKQENARKDFERKKHGPKRRLGDTDKCVVCGKEYVVESPSQKYCSKICAKVGLRNYERVHKPKFAAKKYVQHKQNEKNLFRNTQNVCKYCNRPFNNSTKNRVYCSEHCRKEGNRITQTLSKQRAGKATQNSVDKLIERMEEYRKLFQN